MKNKVWFLVDIKPSVTDIVSDIFNTFEEAKTEWDVRNKYDYTELRIAETVFG